jgi:hypothetical protein
MPLYAAKKELWNCLHRFVCGKEEIEKAEDHKRWHNPTDPIPINIKHSGVPVSSGTATAGSSIGGRVRIGGWRQTR